MEEACAYYLSIGMPLEEYWHGSPHLIWYYKEAHRLRMQEQNQILWMQGLYFKSALDATVGNLTKKRGATLNKYLSEPLPIADKSEREKAAEVEKEKAKAHAYFDYLIRMQKLRKQKQAQKSGEVSVGSNG